jgi:hypothetical protein
VHLLLLEILNFAVKVFLHGTITDDYPPGTDVMFFKIFSPKNLAKILAFFAKTTYC